MVKIQDDNTDKFGLRIRIVGAGMGGLTCALALARAGFRDIQVFETASNLGFVGAGIQLAPNMARILDRLGVWADIEKDAVTLNETSIMRKFDVFDDLVAASTTLTCNRRLYRRGARSRGLALHPRDLWLSSHGGS